MTTRITRRLLLGSAAVALGAAGTVAAPFPDGATLLVGGSGGGPADDWAEWLAPGLGRALPPGTTLRKDVVGGVDGVTAANQFETRTVPDGSTALLLPGSAVMAWLVGDPRARFDAAHWVPALAGVTPGLVISRLPANLALGGSKLRIAVSSAAGPELPAMLALDMLGAAWSPVFGLTEAAATEALAQGQVDAVCLHGRRVAEAAQQFAGSGAQPLFSFGAIDDAGMHQRDPAFPQVPTTAELLTRHEPDEALRRAWVATAAASGLDVAMVLPQLTPAAIVAVWRRAAAQVAGTVPVLVQAQGQGVRVLAGPAATSGVAALLTDAAGQLALRGWLAARLDYRAG